MFPQKIIVPLDGSHRAEQAIPIAAHLAHVSGASIRLLRVFTTVLDSGWAGMGPVMLQQGEIEAEQAEATNYLSHLAASKTLDGLEITTLVAEGLAAQQILLEAQDYQADLIVMCSHGRTGFKRWLLGSVAQKIVRHSSAPVLVLREEMEGLSTNLHQEGKRSVRIMVPLDGSPLAEKVLIPAASLSSALSSPNPGELKLVRILPLLQQNGDVLDAQEQQGGEENKDDIAIAHAYLLDVKQRLSEGELANMPLNISTFVARAADSAGTIIDIAEEGTPATHEQHINPCDIIAMATHGRSGIQRWLLGSVTERVLTGARLPLYIIRPTSPAHEAQTPHKKEAVTSAPL